MKEKYKKHIKDFYEEKSLSSFFNIFSIQTWDRIGFTRSHKGLKVYETTITQNFLHFIYQSIQTDKSHFYMYESLDEKSNGNDIEIFIETNEGFIFFPTQAKMIYKNEKYKSLKHKTKNILQIDSLINYANLKKGLPLYLFYNYSNKYEKLKKYEKKLNDIIEIYGCSLSKAKVIKDKYFNKIIGFHDIILKDTYPLNKLDTNILSNLDIKDLNNIKFYNYNEIANDTKWKNLFPKIGLGYAQNPLNLKRIKTYTNENKNTHFNPKFRILISKEINNTKMLKHILMG